MTIFLKILFWLSVYGLLHSYLFYPLFLKLISLNKKGNNLHFKDDEDWPQVSVLMAMYNEEKVIDEKMNCFLALDYPKNKINFYIGSDCSSDGSNAIVQNFADQHSNIHFFPFTNRQGKPGVINSIARKAFQLHPQSADHILLITDANVMLSESILTFLIRHYKNEEIALVDANMVNTGMKAEGISKSENTYISSEVMIKYREGLAWGTMIGPFGGCYSIRSNYFEEVPPTYLVDDFYITMRMFEQGGKAINDLDAVCYEAISHNMTEEYRRKARISAGNYQNLNTFRHLLWPPHKKLAFAFLSHKVLRWMGPFFIIFAFITCSILALGENQLYRLLFYGQLIILFAIPLLDVLLKKVNINILPFRSINYFINMNMALLEGFFNYLKGIKNNVWEPPKRN